MRTRIAVWLVPIALAAGGIPAFAQDANRRDTLSLGRLHEAALRRDARARQAELNETALELRLRNLAAEWLPRLRVRGEARYQSDVPLIGPADAAPGLVFPEVPKERYEAVLGLEQMLYDGGGIAGRRGVERARTAESQAHLSGTLHDLRREVDQGYFSALVLASRSDETALLIEDLEARLSQARAGVRAGTRLEGDAAVLEAELLRARQRLAELGADRRAALSALANLTGETIGEETYLPAPRLEAEVAAIRREAARTQDESESGLRWHPAFDAFRRTSERLAREADLAGRERLPRVVAFGEAGYGRPGLNQFGDAWDTFWLGGVRLEWTPWTWDRVGRDQALLEVRREAVETEQEAFASALERAVADQVADLTRLREAIAADEQIVRLRERVERQEARRFEEGVITAADYVDARTDLLQARLARRLHRIELAEAQALYLTTLGVPIP
jgi:outer membrane protein TolC